MNSKLAARYRTSRIARILKFKVSVLRDFSRPALAKLSDNILTGEIDLVIDVGANVGQFGIDLRNAGYRGEIFSFEPATSPFRELQKKSEKDSLWTVFNLGLGNRNEEAVLNVATNSGLSSSILQPRLHTEFFPSIKFEEKEKIQVSSLSTIIKDKNLSNRRILLKIDAQGYESYIIEGAIEIFDSVVLTYIELSLVELYREEVGALAILNTLSDLGHRIIDIRRGIESKNGILLQIDVLTRKSS
jgi:FkbM family methyltransferase